MKVRFSIFIIVILFLTTIYCQLNVLGPSALVTKMRSYMDSSGNSLEYSLGNFGDIPYGRTSIGYVFYHKNTDKKNYWCEFDTTTTPTDIENIPNGEYVPIFIVDYNDECSLTRKAYNVKARGGRIMILVSDDKSFKNYKNVDDKIGDRVDIATVIIRKDEGNEIKDYIQNHPYEKVVMSIKFNANRNTDSLNLELFMRSDDLKSLNFFKEFNQYYQKLKNKMIFTPHYKYVKYPDQETSDVPNSVDSQAPCIKETKYCAHENYHLGIYNARAVLMENLRQSCIYKTYHNVEMDYYWHYMMKFAETCADINNPLFTDECSENVMSISGVDPKEIKSCVEKAIESTSIFVENDYELFHKKNVHKIPEFYINGMKYRGNWHANHLMKAICSGFFEDDSVCATPNPDTVNFKDEGGLGIGYVLLIIILIVFAMIVLLVCYKRIVNKSLEESFNEKIRSQTIHSLGQYTTFQDDKPGKKAIDMTNI